MRRGRHGIYLWLEWKNALLRELLRNVPEIVIGHFLVNTSFDSGSLHLTSEQREAGWQSRGTLAFSPEISDVDTIPIDQFDEWLVFTSPSKVESWTPFVNYLGFSIDENFGFDDEFWSALHTCEPESYLAEGENLIFATRNQDLYSLAAARMRADAGNAGELGQIADDLAKATNPSKRLG